MEKESERGAVAVIVGLMMVVLIGFGALAVDVGMLYAQKAQLESVRTRLPWPSPRTAQARDYTVQVRRRHGSAVRGAEQ
ncbi:pilus assembly protein TadG-related protein [Pseudarthrobacter sp. NPDC080039]|uniref:pilus assembly protein TadG-related protein n=1 Tax=unclassified Pseudarthrobacter TaxID=2647000 RepID=UPI00344DEFF8